TSTTSAPEAPIVTDAGVKTTSSSQVTPRVAGAVCSAKVTTVPKGNCTGSPLPSSGETTVPSAGRRTVPAVMVPTGSVAVQVTENPVPGGKTAGSSPSNCLLKEKVPLRRVLSTSTAMSAVPAGSGIEAKAAAGGCTAPS